VYTYLTNTILINSLDYCKATSILYKTVWLKRHKYKKGCRVYKITKNNK